MSSYFKEIILQSRQASRAMSKLTAEDRSKILMNISGFLLNHKNDILQANQLDVERAKSNNLSEPMVNRLILTSENETCWDEIELGRGNNYSINELASMFNTKTTYIDERPGEAKETLCNTLIAKRLIGYEPTRNIEDYIEGVTNETN